MSHQNTSLRLDNWVTPLSLDSISKKEKELNGHTKDCQDQDN